MQLNDLRHNDTPFLYTVSPSTLKVKLIPSSAHEQKSALSTFTGFRSLTFHLYNVCSFYILHLMDLGLIRQSFDLTNTVIPSHIILRLTKLMTVLNNRYASFPPSASLPSHWPSPTSVEDTDAGISGRSVVGQLHFCGDV